MRNGAACLVDSLAKTISGIAKARDQGKAFPSEGEQGIEE